MAVTTAPGLKKGLDYSFPEDPRHTWNMRLHGEANGRLLLGMHDFRKDRYREKQ